MYLFFDTETTGLPKNWNSPVSDLRNWPRMVQIAWIHYDRTGNKVQERSYIIKPEGYTIPRDATLIHGITTARATKEGVGLSQVLDELSGLIEKAGFLIAHNINFDEKIVGAEFLRQGLNAPFNGKERICTMRQTKEFCRLPGNYGYKWPKLSELYKILFDEDIPESHRADVDIAVCAKCFWELRRRGIL